MALSGASAAAFYCVSSATHYDEQVTSSNTEAARRVTLRMWFLR